ncbi:MAG TPA: endonuclease/exonuclease/phosphatase family protein [Alphaproteobacteria bacterium]|nr:endonuclease/exonuclease/phosphatase family protein [Alphaproteobacteria bacterium]
MSIKLASINIERSRHLNEVAAFLEAYRPDVLCLQELMERDIPFFENLMGQRLAYAAMTLHDDYGTPGIMGVAMVARVPLQNTATHYYKGDGTRVPTYVRSGANATERPDTSTINHALLAATVHGLRMATTHLTWTAKGESTPEQLADAGKLLAFADAEAERHGGLLMCGDFNAPRGYPTFAKLAGHFTDGIPAHYKGSLDLTRHRVTKENPAEAERMKSLMVDGLFHTPNYTVTDAKLTAGVSDHMAITATLTV